MLADGKTQQDVADELGCSRTRVTGYQALKDICEEAWKIVTTNSNLVTISNDGMVTKDVTTVTYSERLLRDITCLTPAQQTDLVSSLASGEINKNRFKTLAQA